MICGVFSTDSVSQMCDHLEAERSRPCAGDIIMLNGYFHCHLCPYNTNLKANFQLHTRTDKHLQRVQLVSLLISGAKERLARGNVILMNLCLQLVLLFDY
jgi:hypothetical protein